ncbi:MAG TPA: type II secretion system protein GspG [Planctomycetota bacterium]|nr:type II secretion system protein GspG [Planctomycetota bacterium]
MRLLCLLLLLAPQEGLYRAMKEKIERAKTLRVEYTIGLGEGGRSQPILEGAVKAKGKDRWTVELKLQEGDKRDRKALSLLCDGRKVVVSGGPEGTSSGMFKPEEIAGEIRQCLAVTMIPQAFYLQPEEGGRQKFPEMGAVKAGGKEKVGERDAQTFEYTLKYPGGPFADEEIAVKLWVDAAEKRPLKRELRMQGALWTETFTAFAVDEEIADSEFSFQSPRRLALARAGQLAESVRLFGQFTGRAPASFEDLVRRPAWLEPEVFWPEGGFLLGGGAPKGFELRREADGLRVTGPEASVPVPPVSRQPVGAPTERLQKYYTARVQVQLLAAAARGFRTAYGELPTKKAALWERPEWAEAWPEGGWIPGARMPVDPWGETYRMISEAAFVRVQVNDPKARLLKVLTPEERVALEATARPRLTEAERKEIGALLEGMGDDDLETREKAMAGLKAWGPAAMPLLETRMKVEKDAEARGRLQAARREIPTPPAAYLGELAALSVSVSLDAGGGASNERNASACLKVLATAEADFRANDRDNNKVNDFWTGDVAGLYTLDPGGGSIKLIELSMALADTASLEKGAAAGKIPKLTDFGQPAPKGGYSFRAMTHDKSSGKPEPYANETDGDPKMGKVHNTVAFGFCAYPSEYGVTGTRTFIISEGNAIFWKDSLGEAVLEWPGDGDLARGWSKLD